SRVHSQRYNASADPVGTPFEVNTITKGQQVWPRVAVQPSGGFLVTWAVEKPGTVESDIFGRLFSANGLPLTDEFRINLDPAGNQQAPFVSTDGAGNFAVVWTSTIGSASRIQGRLISS